MARTTCSPQGARIRLDDREVINLAANNYLGLANSPELIAAAKQAMELYGVGPGAGRTIVGNYPAHNELETKLAEFKGVEATLSFNSGLAANMGVIPALVGKEDIVFSDELNHASLIDGCRLSRAEVNVYRHLDVSSLQNLLGAADQRRKKLILSDGVFSMDGDLAPLPDIVTLAQKYGAAVMIDDAHGDGVMGHHGQGTVDYYGLRKEVAVETGSFSKAFGTVGGFVAGTRDFIDTLRQTARTFVFTSSPLPPSMAAATVKALEIISADDHRLKALWHNRDYFAARIAELGFSIGNSKTPIIPVYVGDKTAAQQMTEKLYEEGVFSQAIYYPIVPVGQARLRVMVSSVHTKDDLDQALQAFAKAGRELGLR